MGRRLLDAGAPLAACLAGSNGQECAAALASLRNPYAIENDPGAFHTTGWHAAAVDFAREHHAGLVIKGTGHNYLGRSCPPAR